MSACYDNFRAIHIIKKEILMSKKDMDSFVEALRGNQKLADVFAKAVSEAALDNGYDVEPRDVLRQFSDDVPAPRRLPDDDDIRATTQAIGEEGGRRFTMAIGEDGRGVPRPPVTSKSIGEEGGKPRR
jgi:hypothetical protein